jgi:outer membrane protein assembly factor BamB
VAGYQNGGEENGSDWALLCYRTRDGKLLWKGSGGRGSSAASEIVVSADGTRIYAVGNAGKGRYILTMGFDARTGRAVWRERYNLPTGRENGVGIRVAPAGDRIFILAGVQRVRNEYDYDTVLLAYGNLQEDAEPLWETTTHTDSYATSERMAMTPSGDALFVSTLYRDPVDEEAPRQNKTVKVNAIDGHIEWSVEESDVVPHLVEVDPDGATIYIAGCAPGTEGGGRAAAVARDAETGEARWTSVQDTGTQTTFVDGAVDRGRDLFVATGHAEGVKGRTKMITGAFDTETGDIAWSARSNYPDLPYRTAEAATLSLGPDGWVYVGGVVETWKNVLIRSDLLVSGYEPR